MDKINCLICGKIIPNTDLVCGDNGAYKCANCFNNTFNKQIYTQNRKEFYNNRRSWNDTAKKQMQEILNNCNNSNYKPKNID